MQSRRVFIKSGAMAMVTMGFAPSFLARTAAAAGTGRRLLIAVFQRGAVDGLNMVVPFGEAEYYRVRPSIAIARPGREGGAIDLDGFFGLHPRLSPFKPLWDQGALAIVHASGSHDATRSHFDAQDYMESGTPGVKSTRDGWLNRYLQGDPRKGSPLQDGEKQGDPRKGSPLPDGEKQGDPRKGSPLRDGDEHGSPLRAVAITGQMPRALQGAAPALAMGSIREFGVRGDMSTQASFESAYEAAADRVLNGTASSAFDAMRTLSKQAAGRYRPADGVTYPRTPFGQALQEIAALAKADVGLEIAFAESTQWDHHVNEGGATGQIANRLTDFAAGIAALVQDLGSRMADTVILTMSEFGRAVAENGNRGTDHGHGNAMFLIGGAVKGGKVYGQWPGLAPEVRYEGRDLAVTTDFRDVFSEVVVGHLGATAGAAGRVFPGYSVKPSAFRGVIRV